MTNLFNKLRALLMSPAGPLFVVATVTGLLTLEAVLN